MTSLKGFGAAQPKEEIRDIIFEQAGVRREQVTLEARLRGDLEIN
jgi:hypothetical protein